MTHELFENFNTLDEAMDYIAKQNKVNADLLEALVELTNVLAEQSDLLADNAIAYIREWNIAKQAIEAANAS